MKGEQFRRTVYVQFRRSRPLSVLDPFDLPRMSPNCTQRFASTVSTQSLLLMNNPMVWDRARQMARRARRVVGDELPEQVRWMWLAAYGRQPTPEEIRMAERFVEIQTAQFAARPWPKEQSDAPDAAEEALTSMCHAVVSSNEFLYVD